MTGFTSFQVNGEEGKKPSVKSMVSSSMVKKETNGETNGECPMVKKKNNGETNGECSMVKKKNNGEKKKLGSRAFFPLFFFLVCCFERVRFPPSFFPSGIFLNFRNGVAEKKKRTNVSMRKFL